jgi:hypothetical protein
VPTLRRARGAAGTTYFRYVHAPVYQNVEWAFLEAVHTLDPQVVMRVLNMVRPSAPTPSLPAIPVLLGSDPTPTSSSHGFVHG